MMNNMLSFFIKKYTTWDYFLALFLGALNILLFALNSSFFMWIQLFHAINFFLNLYLVKNNKADKIPLCWYCNFIIAPLFIVLLELKIIFALYSYMKDFFFSDYHYYPREKFATKLIKNIFYSPIKNNNYAKIIKTQEPKQIGMSFRNYLEESDTEYRDLRSDYDSLLKKFKEKEEEIVKLKRNSNDQERI